MDTLAQTTATDWPALLESWDKQQTAYIAHREERFAVMLQALADQIGTNFTFVDLGCGPGSLTQRVLDAFPQDPRLRKGVELLRSLLEESFAVDIEPGEPEEPS